MEIYQTITKQPIVRNLRQCFLITFALKTRTESVSHQERIKQCRLDVN